MIFMIFNGTGEMDPHNVFGDKANEEINLQRFLLLLIYPKVNKIITL